MWELCPVMEMKDSDIIYLYYLRLKTEEYPKLVIAFPAQSQVLAATEGQGWHPATNTTARLQQLGQLLDRRRMLRPPRLRRLRERRQTLLGLGLRLEVGLGLG